MELNEAIEAVTGIKKFDAYCASMKKLLPAYKDVRKRVEKNKLINPAFGICRNMEVYMQLTKSDNTAPDPYKVTQIMASIWPGLNGESTVFPIAGCYENRFEKWTVNKARRLEFLDFIIETLEKIK